MRSKGLLAAMLLLSLGTACSNLTLPSALSNTPSNAESDSHTVTPQNHPTEPSAVQSGVEVGEQKPPAVVETLPELQTLAFAQPDIVVYPGNRYALELVYTYDDGSVHAGGEEPPLFTSSQEEWATVDKDGFLSIEDHAEIGSKATIVAKFDTHEAHLQLTVKYSLDETLDPSVASAIPVITNPHSYTLLVNKVRSLPDGFSPEDLVKPNVPFSFSGEHEKMHLRETAARALESLFAAAKEEQIQLTAVSGYRSRQTQQGIYNWNVNNKGEAHAKRYSAFPGTSEHQTGLAMDVSAASVNYGLTDKLGDKPEGKWMAEHAAAFGFIIRYPLGKEEITGYAYEPWHLRYVGPVLAAEIVESGLTLEEFFEEGLPAAAVKPDEPPADAVSDPTTQTPDEENNGTSTPAQAPSTPSATPDTAVDRIAN